MCQIIFNGVPFTAFQCNCDPDLRGIGLEMVGLETEEFEDDSLDHLADVDAYLESKCNETLDEFKEKR